MHTLLRQSARVCQHLPRAHQRKNSAYGQIFVADHVSPGQHELIRAHAAKPEMQSMLACQGDHEAKACDTQRCLTHTCRRAWRSLTVSTMSIWFSFRSAMGSIIAGWPAPSASVSSCEGSMIFTVLSIHLNRRYLWSIQAAQKPKGQHLSLRSDYLQILKRDREH